MTKVWWHATFPAELRAVVEPLVHLHMALMPTWVHELCVYYAPLEANAAATMGADPEYRRAKLTITGDFFNASDEDRQQMMLHEFIHLPVSPLTNFTHALIDKLEDEQLKLYLRDHWRQCMEGMVCDFEKIIADMHARIGLIVP